MLGKLSQFIWRMAMGPLKTKDYQFDNFVIIGGTVSCYYDYLRCHQRQQSQTDDLCFQCQPHMICLPHQ